MKSEKHKFYEDVKEGLLSNPKKLSSKYFYDKTGDAIFQKLMHSPEYYLSECEMNILKEQSPNIASTILKYFNEFDLIELGAGDASKSIYLLQALQRCDAKFTYCPIDISHNIIQLLEEKLPKLLPSLQIRGLNGEYLDMLRQVASESSKPKVVLFLGSNIGNMSFIEATAFCEKASSIVRPGDLFLVGVDLKKSPLQILAAYDDQEGLTRDFNLNLLRRINNELDGNFDLNAFYHYPSYDPISGECKSFLISTEDQEVSFGSEKEESTIIFTENEPIFMEISKKYSLGEIEELATNTGFHVTNHFFDPKKWFVDSVWKKV